MTTFREERERVRKRCELVGRVVAETISDPDLRISVARAPHLQHSATVTMRIVLACDFLVHDDTTEADMRSMGPLAYRKLAVYARTHFFDHLGTDPALRSGA